MSFLTKIVCKDREDRNIRFNSMRLTHADVSRGTEQVDNRMEWVVYHGPSLEGGVEDSIEAVDGADIGVAELASPATCPKCGVLFAAHNDDGSCMPFESANS